MKLHGRVVYAVRLENNSQWNLAVPTSGFLAVDEKQTSYRADDANSSFQFESDENGLSSWQAGPFAAGTTRTGTVALDSNLNPGVAHLQLRFTAAYQDPNDFPNHIHFTVFVDTAVPKGAS